MEESLRTVISGLVEKGVFGDVKLVDLQPDETELGAQFSSVLAFVNLTVEGSSGKEIFSLVVKLPFSDPNMRIARNCDAMFHNEVIMYKEILPGLGVDEQMYPKMYYGVATSGVDPDSDLLILENLKYSNFVLSKTKVFLDIDHISVAIKKIAEFHSYSFKLKHDNMERFLAIAKKLKGVVLSSSNNFDFGPINVAAFERGVKPLLKKNVKVDELTKCLNFLKFSSKIRALIEYPEEAIAVICHGDYFNGNAFYKYDESGKPVDCVLFDFQLSKYTSPAIDLFLFLYMHTTSDFREKYWDQILQLYWDTLRESVPDHINIPSFEEFLNDFSKRAVYACVICALYLPEMLVENPFKMDEIYNLPVEEKITHFVSQGGVEGERVISEIVLHLLKRGYIESFIKFCTENHVEC